MGLDEELAKSYAKIIADACANVDTGWTVYWNPFAQGWHFNTNIMGGDSRDTKYANSYKKAEKAAKNGKTEDVLKELGKGLHALQDQVVHIPPNGDIPIPIGAIIGAPQLAYHVHYPSNSPKYPDIINDANLQNAFLATIGVLMDFQWLSSKHGLRLQ